MQVRKFLLYMKWHMSRRNRKKYVARESTLKKATQIDCLLSSGAAKDFDLPTFVVGSKFYFLRPVRNQFPKPFELQRAIVKELSGPQAWAEHLRDN
jgi:hypothetical protein